MHAVIPFFFDMYITAACTLYLCQSKLFRFLHGNLAAGGVTVIKHFLVYFIDSAVCPYFIFIVGRICLEFDFIDNDAVIFLGFSFGKFHRRSFYTGIFQDSLFGIV